MTKLVGKNEYVTLVKYGIMKIKQQDKLIK